MEKAIEIIEARIAELEESWHNWNTIGKAAQNNGFDATLYFEWAQQKSDAIMELENVVLQLRVG